MEQARINTSSMTDGEWRGYVTARLEDINACVCKLEAKSIRDEDSEKRLRNKVAGIAASLAMVISLVVSFLGILVKHITGK